MGTNVNNGTASSERPSGREELSASVGLKGLDGVRYEHLLEAVPVAVALLHPEKGLIYLNRRAMELYGADHTGLDTIAYIARISAVRPDGTPFEVEEMPGYRAFRTGRTVRNVEMSIRGANGAQMPLLVSAAPLFDESNKAIAAIIVFDDIRERKKLEEAAERAQLAESEDRHLTLVSASSELVFRMNPDWSELRQLRSHGLLDNVDHPIRDWIDIYIPEEQRPRMIAQIREGVKSEKPANYEHLLKLRDGSTGWFLTRAVPIRDAGGNIVEWFGLSRDITGRKNAEQALKEANSRLETELAAIKRLQDIGTRMVDFGEMRSILDEILDAAIALVRADKGNIQFLDPRSGDLNMVAQRGFGPAFRDHFAVVCAGVGSCGTALVRGERVIVEDVNTDPIFAGTPHLQTLLDAGVMAAVSTPLVSRSGKLLGMLSTHYRAPHRPDDMDLRLLDLLARQAADLIERTQAEEELRRYAEALKRSNADLQQFAYVASHDLREPLRMVSSYLDLLRKRYEDKLVDPQAKEYMHFAVDGAERMQQMIDDLLTYSRIGTKGKPFAPVDMDEVMSIACKDLEARIRESGASITWDKLPSVTADQTQILLVLENLISNAIKFRRAEPPQVHVSAGEAGSEWLFSVRDNGIGIDTMHQDRLFHMFQRLHTREEYEGTGIGLAICKKIVERHGGKIWFESEVDIGSIFYFTISARRSDGQAP